MKPKNEFRRMKVFQSELIYPDTNDDTYLYFVVDHLNINTIKNLLFEIDNLRVHNLKVEFYFNSDKDVALTKNNPFLPMPIKDKHISNKFLT